MENRTVKISGLKALALASYRHVYKCQGLITLLGVHSLARQNPQSNPWADQPYLPVSYPKLRPDFPANSLFKKSSVHFLRKVCTIDRLLGPAAGMLFLSI